MGYRIVYDGREGKYEVKAHKPSGFWVAAGMILLLIFTLWKGSVEFVREAVIPGDNRTTLSALRNLTEHLSQGVGFLEAAEVFCAEVIHGSIPAN